MLFQIACDVDLKTLVDVHRDLFNDTDLLIEQSRHGEWCMSHAEQCTAETRLFMLYTSDVDAISKIDGLCKHTSTKHIIRYFVTYHFN